MTICLSKEGCQKNNISLAEALLMLAIHNNADLDTAQKELIKKGYITANRDDLFQQIGWRLTNKGTEVIDSVQFFLHLQTVLLSILLSSCFLAIKIFVINFFAPYYLMDWKHSIAYIL
jgi:hypothetical protein